MWNTPGKKKKKKKKYSIGLVESGSNIILCDLV